MTSLGYSRSPKLLKGALLRLDGGFLNAVPQAIVFQYNPESLHRRLKPYERANDREAQPPNAPDTAQPYDPQEEIQLPLEFDAADALETPETHPVAVLAGVADRIAALEMLLYPAPTGGLRDSVASTLGNLAGGAGAGATAQRPEVPIVLFFWGPGRVVPARITGFEVDEQAFLPSLYAVRAKVTVGLTVLTEAALAQQARGRSLTSSERLGQAAYRYTMRQKQALANANLTNALDLVTALL